MTEEDSFGQDDTNMDFKIVIPIYKGGEIIKNLLATIDVDWSHLILVDNSPESVCKDYEGKGATILYYPENIGVGRAWNIGLKAGCDWTFILSQAAVFPNGFSSFLLGVNPNDECYLTTEGWHAVGIRKSVVDKIGFIDTNYFPGYHEDFDYYRRMCLAGITHGELHKAPLAITSIGSSGGTGHVNFDALNAYSQEKWNGGPNSPQEGMYQLPFGDKPLSYFPERSITELKKKYGL